MTQLHTNHGGRNFGWINGQRANNRPTSIRYWLHDDTFIDGVLTMCITIIISPHSPLLFSAALFARLQICLCDVWKIHELFELPYPWRELNLMWLIWILNGRNFNGKFYELHRAGSMGIMLCNFLFNLNYIRVPLETSSLFMCGREIV